jgi:hypothetical protein
MEMEVDIAGFDRGRERVARLVREDPGGVATAWASAEPTLAV